MMITFLIKKRKTFGYNGIVFPRCMSCSTGYYPHLDTCRSSCPAGYKLLNQFYVCVGWGFGDRIITMVFI